MIQYIDRAERCIIIDTTALVKWFMAELAKAPIADYNIPELISEACNLLASQHSFTTNLGFITDRIYENYLYKTNCAVSAKMISLTWVTFTGGLVDVYTNNNLWDEQGVSNLYYRALSGYDIILAFYQPDADAFTLVNNYIAVENTTNDRFNRNGIAA